MNSKNLISQNRVLPSKSSRRPSKVSAEDEFYCRPRRRRLTLDKCLEDYMNANAFGSRRSACWRCPQGCANRSQFAGSV